MAAAPFEDRHAAAASRGRKTKNTARSLTMALPPSAGRLADAWGDTGFLIYSCLL
jgi:hypothetical protein